MARPARPERRFSANISVDGPAQRGADPVYLRHRFHGELGQMLRDYYADVVDEPLPDRLLRLVEQFREKEQNR